MPASPSHRAARGWLVQVASGILWGGAITAIETLRQPPAGLPIGALVAFMLALLLVWCGIGVCLALATRLAARVPSISRMVVLWVVTSGFFSACQAAINYLPEPFDGGASVRSLLGAGIPLDALFTHSLWQNAVFGGLYIAGHAAFQRALRARRQLAWLQVALSEQAALLEEARLHSLRGTLKPEILLEAVHGLQSRYDTDFASADALLDRLVTYLRAATGSARREPSHETATPEAAEAYRALRDALEQAPCAGVRRPASQLIDDRNLT